MQKRPDQLPVSCYTSLMIPMGYFLLAWMILLGIHGVLTLLTLMQLFRNGSHSPATYLAAFGFLAVIVGVVIGSGSYFLNVDWNQQIDIVPSGLRSVIPGINTAPDDILLDQ